MKKLLYIYIYFLLFSCTTVLTAQIRPLPEVIDSIKLEYKEKRRANPYGDSLQMEIALEIAERGATIAHPEVDSFAHIALRLAKRLDIPTGIGRSYIFRGTAQWYEGDLERCLGYIDTALSILKEQEDFYYYNTARLIKGTTLYRMGNRAEGNRQFFDVLDATGSQCHEPHKNRCGLLAIYANFDIGNTYFDREEYNDAENYFSRMLSLAEGMQEHFGEDHEVIIAKAIALGSIANIKAKHEEFENALSYNQRAFETFTYMHNKAGEAVCLHNISESYFKLKKYYKAEQVLLQTLDLIYQEEFNFLLTNSLSLMADIQMERKNYDEARTYLMQAIDNAEEDQDVGRDIIESYELLVRLDSLTGNHSAAMINMNKLVQLRDSFARQDKADKVAELDYQFKTSEKEKELLAEQEQVALLKKQRMNLISIVVSVLALVLFLGGYYFQYNRKRFLSERDRALKEKAEAEAYQQELNKELERTSNELNYKKQELANVANRLLERTKFIEELGAQIEALGKETTNQSQAVQKIKRQLVYQQQITKELEDVRIYLNKVNQDFFYTLEQRYPTLTENDKRLCALLRLNLSARDIATLNNVSPSAIRTGKHRLRKKLNLKEGEELEGLLQGL